MSKLVPDLRFKEFNNDWNIIKIKDVLEITRGDVLSKRLVSEIKTDTNKYPVYSSQTLKNGLVGYYHKFKFEDCITWTTDGAKPGTVRLRKGKFYCTNVCGVLRNEEFNNICVTEILNREAWKHVLHVGNPKLMNNVMGDIKIKIPTSLEEQNRIASFLSNIDKKIKLMEEIQDLNLKYKKGLLQQMFVSNSVGGALNSPTLRFKGFTEDWKSVKLKDVFTIITEKNNGTSENILSVSANYGMIAQSEIFSKRIDGNNITKYSLVKKGDFVYNRSRSSKNPWGVIKCLKDYDMGVVSSVYFVLRPNNTFNELYLENYFLTKTFERELGNVVSKSVRALLNVTKTDFLSLNIKHPSKTEQEKISSFFSSIDIDLKSNIVKLENLKLWKKSLLQKMFV